MAKAVNTQGQSSAPHAWSQAQWDAAYDNSGAVPNSARYIEIWKQKSKSFRNARRLSAIDLPYGPGPRETFDLFLPDTSPPKGLFIFIHGGYWLRFSKNEFSHMASGALERGMAVAIPSYSLKPGVHMGQIVEQIEQAIASACEHVGGSIYIAGHSAGGHLTAMLAREGSQLTTMAKSRIKRFVAISGVFDLSPLTNLTMNQNLELSQSEAFEQSPINAQKREGVDFVTTVGEAELEAFLQQSTDFAAKWKTPLIIAKSKHHFDIIEDLEKPDSGLMNVLFD